MTINKQAKILSQKQQELILMHFDTTRYPSRNKVMFMLSFKAGLRAKEIANITWLMLCNSDSEISDIINLPNKASKGKSSGRVIPLQKDLKELLSNANFVYLSQT